MAIRVKTVNFAIMSKQVHIGRKIKEVLIESRLKKTEFAVLINTSRTVVYDIFKRETIDTALLQKISAVLKHDFFSYLQNTEFLSVKDKQTGYGYASKEELQELTKTVHSLLSLVEKLDQKVDSIAPKKSRKRKK